jgi:hypothetical protein
VLREILNFLVFRMLWLIIRTFRLHLQQTFRIAAKRTSFPKNVFLVLAASFTQP